MANVVCTKFSPDNLHKLLFLLHGDFKADLVYFQTFKLILLWLLNFAKRKSNDPFSLDGFTSTMVVWIVSPGSLLTGGYHISSRLINLLCTTNAKVLACLHVN